MMERETQTPHPTLPPWFPTAASPKGDPRPVENRELGNHGVHKYMVHVVAGPAQQLLQHTHGVLGLLPPCLGQSWGR